MKKLLFIFKYILFISLSMNAQDYLNQWDQDDLEKANTATNTTFLGEKEKQIIFYTNLARLNGELFANTILDDYMKKKRSTRYTRSLYRDLKKIKGLPLLRPEKDLQEIAEEHATTSGKRGTTGHQRFNKRYGPLMGTYNEVAENCAYGLEDPLHILIQLLIDEEIPDVGHRKNLLNPNFNSIGVSIKHHKKYVYNCVMSFGKRVK